MKLAEFHRRRYAGCMSAPKRNSYIVSRLKEKNGKAKEQQASRPFPSIIYLFYLLPLRSSRFSDLPRKFFSMFFFHRPETKITVGSRDDSSKKSSFIYHRLRENIFHCYRDRKVSNNPVPSIY